MGKQKSIKVNFIMNIFLTLSGIIFPLITYPYVARILSPEGMGKISFVNSVVSYFALFAQLGIPTYGIRACAKVRDDRNRLSKVVSELFIINLITTIISYIVLFVLIKNIIKFNSEKTLFYVLSSSMIFNLIGMEWLFKALEEYTYITIRSVIFKFLGLILMFILIHKPQDYIIYGIILIIASYTSSILNFVKARHYVKINIWGKLEIIKHIRPIIVFFASTCATTIYTNLDNVMIGVMKTNIEVGYYSTAIKVKIMLTSCVTALGAVLLPRASYYIENKLMDEFNIISRKAMNFVVLIALPMVIYFTIFAKECISVLAGTAYDAAVLPMQIMMPTVLIIGMTNIMGTQMMILLGRENRILYAHILAAITDLTINLLLIPRFSIIGAAVGTLFAEVVVWIVQFYGIRDKAKIIYGNISYYKYVVATVIALISGIIIKIIDINCFIKLVISAFFFFTIYIICLCLIREKFFMELTASLFKKRNKV